MLSPISDRSQKALAAVALIGVLGLLAALAGRVLQINTTLRPKLLVLAEDQHRGDTHLPARRGMILDARGRTVAATRLTHDVFVDATRITNVEGLGQQLGARINLPPAEITEAIRKRPNSRYVVVAEGVDAVSAEAVEAMKNPAAGVADRPIRMYPLGESMAHVLGLVGRDGKGLEGIELAFDDHLRGRDGRRSTIRDARRRLLRPADEASTQPVDGGHLVLTIDAEIQQVTEDALQRTVTRFEAESGVAIVMSPKNGDILAMACIPSFDPNEPAAYPPAARRNRALTDPVEPGSTFKPFVVSGALEGKFVAPGDHFDTGNGQRAFGSRIIRDTHPHGTLDLRGVVAKSSNIGMVLIAERVGNRALHETVRRFGFGERTGIELPGEDQGVVYPLKKWGSFSTPSIGMGYEINITPLQLITAFCALVNDGVLLKPRVVRSRLGPDGELLSTDDQPHAVRRVVRADIARFVAHDLLVSVIEEGTGSRMNLKGYRALGKTGTAKLTNKGHYEPGAYLSTFLAAAPEENPELVALVMVRRPNAQIGYYGGTVSAPAVGEILEASLPYLGIMPEDQLAQAE